MTSRRLLTQSLGAVTVACTLVGAWSCGGTTTRSDATGGSAAASGQTGGEPDGGSGGALSGGGGTAAVGGAVQGTGGSVGGSGGIAPRPTSMEAACRAMAGSGCMPPDYTEAQCLEEIFGARQEAIVDGCVHQFDALIDCIAQYPPICPEPYVYTDWVCDPVALQLEQCPASPPPPDPDECLIGVGVGTGGAAGQGMTCDMICPTYSATCTELRGGMVECVCTQGPNQGMGMGGPGTCLESLESFAHGCAPMYP